MWSWLAREMRPVKQSTRPLNRSNLLLRNEMASELNSESKVCDMIDRKVS